MAVPNTSATGGYLKPNAAPAPLQGNALNDFWQQVVVGITGLNGQYVRPALQGEPPVIPPAAVAWAAINTGLVSADTFPFVGHLNDVDQIQNNEQIAVLVSFYDLGTDGLAGTYASLLRDGLMIAQNREVMQRAGMALLSVGPETQVPSLLKERWLVRMDLPIQFGRCVVREYSVKNLLSEVGTLAFNPGPVLSIDVGPITAEE